MYGDRIRDLRKLHKMSQTELAEKIGVTQQNIYCYEHERTQPTFESICLIADLFDTTTDYILGRTSVREYGKKSTPDELAQDIKVAETILDDPKKWAKSSAEISEIVLRQLIRAEVDKVLDERKQDSHLPE